jgi:hypothetical protein
LCLSLPSHSICQYPEHRWLLAAGLELKAKKCHLFYKKAVYLEHVISEAGIATDPEKTKNVESWPVPTNVKELRSFMGFCGYYRKLIQNFSTLAKCLHKLPASTVSINLSNVAGAPFSPNGMTRNS